jgi:hypothetical protein
MPGHWIPVSVILENIFAVHLKSVPVFMLGWSHVLRKVPKILMRHGIPRLEQCCTDVRILTSLSLSWHGTVLMDFRDHVTFFWLPESGIIQNKSWLPKSHMA